MNWKTPVTMLVLLGILLGAAYYGWSTIVSPDDKKDTGATQTPAAKKGPGWCAPVKRFKKGQTVKATDIRVNVYNAGLISGLAGETLDSLTSKGFKAGVASNAPGQMSAANVTIVTKEPESPEVRLVRMQFRGPVKVVKGDLAPGIDVLVGDKFQSVDSTIRTEITLRKNINPCKKASG